VAVSLNSVDAVVSGAAGWNISVSGGAAPKGVLISIDRHQESINAVSAVRYGGTLLSYVSGAPVLKTTGEDLSVHVYFLGSAVPTGTQEASASFTNTADHQMVVYILDADADLTVQDTGTVSSDSLANPAHTLALGGNVCWCAALAVAGRQSPAGTAPLSGWTMDTEYDHGGGVGLATSYDTISDVDVSAGFTQAADDVGMLVIAITEEVSEGPTQNLDNMTGIASVTAFGSHVISEEAHLVPEGIASTTAFGTDYTITERAYLVAEGIASTTAFGSHAIAETQHLDVTGIASTTAFGDHAISETRYLDVTGIASTTAFGSHDIAEEAHLVVEGIASVTAFGDHGIETDIPTQFLDLDGGAIASITAFGSHTITEAAQLVPEGIASVTAFGSHTITEHARLEVTGIASVTAFGDHGIAAGSVPQFLDLDAGGIASVTAFGSNQIETPFIAADLEMWGSGASNIGGAIGALLTNNSLNNIWDDVSVADAAAGDIEYRCVYVRNINSATQVLNTKVTLKTDPAESDWEIGLGAAGLNGSETAVADESTPPGGVSFGVTTLNVGTLNHSDYYPIWIKRTVIAGAGAATPDTGVLEIAVDAP